MAGRMILCFVLCFGIALGGNFPKLNIDISKTTVSGLGAGAYFSSQFHLSYSNVTQGAALFGGGPYYCAQGNYLNVATDCTISPQFITVSTLTKSADTFAEKGFIDPLSNLGDDRVYLFHGGNDQTYFKGCTTAAQQFYSHYNVTVGTSINKIPCGHGQPVNGAGVQCSATEAPFINDCDWDGYYNALDYLTPGLKNPVNAVSSNLQTFDQTPYWSDLSCFGPTGYMYIPTKCSEGKQCTVHIAFHDCDQDLNDVGSAYVKNAGLNGVAEANEIVVLYPQMQKSAVDPYNPDACWDWWGYTQTPIDPVTQTFKYATQIGKQPPAVYRMLSNLAGIPL